MKSIRPVRLAVAGLLAALVLPVAPAAAQEEAAVAQVIHDFFEHMRVKDSAALRAHFTSTGRLVGLNPRTTPPTPTVTTVDAFIGAVMGAPELDEKVYDPEVRIDGNLATVWTSYDILVGGRFSHCGYDAFHLVKIGDAWRITQVADTRQPQGCTTPRAPK